MAILVTGGAGYIGSHVVQALRAAGESVVVFDNMSTGSRLSVPADVDVVEADLSDRTALDSVFARFSIEAVMHFAASVIVSESMTDPLAYFANNTANTLTLLQAMQAAGVKRLVFSSTAAVYGTPDVPLVDETIPPSPISPYGSSKLMCEMMAQAAAAAYDLRYVALRYFNVAGAALDGSIGPRNPKATHLIKLACLAATGRLPEMQILGTDYATPDGTALRDFIHVADLALIHGAALSYLRHNGVSTVLNCGYGQGHSVRQVIESVQRISGVDFPVIECPRRAGDPPQVVANNALLLKTLNWTPCYADLDVMVGTALAWERKMQTLAGACAAT